MNGYRSRPVQPILVTLPGTDAMNFVLPPELEASMPPEARELARDEVRLMVSYRSNDHVVHSQFRALGDFLTAGDLLVINTSGTMNAALNAVRSDGTALELHLSTHLPTGMWVVEVRKESGKTTAPFYEVNAGETLHLAGGAQVILHEPYAGKNAIPSEGPHRLWLATLHLAGSWQEYLARYGFPIRYGYVQQAWPTEYYQTVYATEIGSAEMPSAGRAFTAELITSLVAHGIQIAPVILHTGVASLEAHEFPYEEYYRVPAETARMVNAARAGHKRVVAVGTTVVRALETVASEDGTVHGGEGWTALIVTPERGIHAVNALLTGFHEPHATHLLMLQALARLEHLKIAYNEALREGYLWHEFGDLHLILP